MRAGELDEADLRPVGFDRVVLFHAHSIHTVRRQADWVDRVSPKHGSYYAPELCRDWFTQAAAMPGVQCQLGIADLTGTRPAR
jgi:hypothetical protein